MNQQDVNFFQLLRRKKIAFLEPQKLHPQKYGAGTPKLFLRLGVAAIFWCLEKTTHMASPKW